MPPSPGAQRTLRITCPLCHERMEVDLTDHPQMVACVFCETPITVPSREQAQHFQKAQDGPVAPPVEEYRLAATDPPPGAETDPGQEKIGKKRRKPKAGTAEEQAESHLTVSCPTCHERMRVVPHESPSAIACTYCGTSVPVPGRGNAKAWKPAPIRPKDRDSVGAYATGAVPAVPKIHTNLFDRLAQIRTEEVSPPPRWTFFSGVFLFPWSTGVLPRWGWMSLGYVLPMLILYGVSYLGPTTAAGGVGNVAVVGIGFLMLPLIWLTLMTFSYSADCFLRVLESTAYGNDRVVEWPEGGWREWMPNLLYVGWVGTIPVVASCGIAHAAGFRHMEFWQATIVALFYLYPISLMSALEANSIWVPLTKQVIKSLFVVGWAWIVFYLLVSLLAAVLLLAANYGVGYLGFAGWILLGFLIPTEILIYARLMGRLAWKIGGKLSS